jgi:hypothetical protein
MFFKTCATNFQTGRHLRCNDITVRNRITVLHTSFGERSAQRKYYTVLHQLFLNRKIGVNMVSVNVLPATVFARLYRSSGERDLLGLIVA